MRQVGTSINVHVLLCSVIHLAWSVCAPACVFSAIQDQKRILCFLGSAFRENDLSINTQHVQRVPSNLSELRVSDIVLIVLEYEFQTDCFHDK